MFDIDGTLVKSYDFDGECYVEAVHKILGHQLDADWSKYINVTDDRFMSYSFNLSKQFTDITKN